MCGRNPTYYRGDLYAELLLAAENEVAERGASGTSLRSLARRVGVSHAAPAHHFQDKRGLFTALALVGFTDLGTAMGHAREQHRHEAAADQLRAMGLAYLDFSLRRPGLFQVMWRSDLQHADDPALRAAGDATLEALRAVVSEAQQQGWATGRDPRTVAFLMWSAVHGLAVLWRDGPLAEEADGQTAQQVASDIGQLLRDALT